jgi:hypothetical protein
MTAGPHRKFVALAMLVPLLACAAVQQYPDDPEDTQANLASYSAYFGAAKIADYALSTGTDRTQKRDDIVLNRMLAYDITYSNFKRRLLIDGNSISTGGDLISLALTGLAATTGSASTKAALAAAATGVIGAKAAINTDLYYQRTLPALIAQMDATRLKAKVALLQGLSKQDADYPLGRALVDLNTLKDAGGVTQAIQDLSTAAGEDRAAADQALTMVHGQAFKDTFNARQQITTDINALTDTQVLALMRAMDQKLPTRSDTVQAQIKMLDPHNAREKLPTRARIVLGQWAAMENPDNAQEASSFTTEWTTAIAAAKKQG